MPDSITPANDSFVGVLLRSRDVRDDGRTVRVIEDHGNRVRIENLSTERRTFIRLPLRGWDVIGRG